MCAHTHTHKCVTFFSYIAKPKAVRMHVHIRSGVPWRGAFLVISQVLILSSYASPLPQDVPNMCMLLYRVIISCVEWHSVNVVLPCSKSTRAITEYVSLRYILLMPSVEPMVYL